MPQSNFLSTVIFNFDHAFFFGVFCHFLKIISSHWISATKESSVCYKKGVFFLLFLWPNQCFLCRTDSVRQTNFNEMAINAKKEDIVRIENHCSKKMSLIVDCLKFCLFRCASISSSDDRDSLTHSLTDWHRDWKLETFLEIFRVIWFFIKSLQKNPEWFSH